MCPTDAARLLAKGLSTHLDGFEHHFEHFRTCFFDLIRRLHLMDMDVDIGNVSSNAQILILNGCIN